MSRVEKNYYVDFKRRRPVSKKVRRPRIFTIAGLRLIPDATDQLATLIELVDASGMKAWQHLSPSEARRLRDWLSRAIEWMEQEKR